MCKTLLDETFRLSHHDGVREIAVSLVLQSHGSQFSSYVTFRGGLVQGGLPDLCHLGSHKERQHTLVTERFDVIHKLYICKQHICAFI